MCICTRLDTTTSFGENDGLSGESMRLGEGACGKADERRAELAGGEGVEGAEAGGEFGGGPEEKGAFATGKSPLPAS